MFHMQFSMQKVSAAESFSPLAMTSSLSSPSVLNSVVHIPNVKCSCSHVYYSLTKCSCACVHRPLTNCSSCHVNYCWQVVSFACKLPPHRRPHPFQLTIFGWWWWGLHMCVCVCGGGGSFIRGCTVQNPCWCPKKLTGIQLTKSVLM